MDKKRYVEYVKQYIQECAVGQQDSLMPLLSMFKIRGRPMNMRLHFQLAPMFKLASPKRQVWQCARQVGKSFGISSKGQLMSSLMPDFHTLFVQPRFDQIKRFNQTVLRPLMRSNLLKDDLISAEDARAFLLKTFRNNSNLYLEYAFINAERIRGISGVSAMFIDEAQDIDDDFLPIIRETMSAAMRHRYEQYTGTPKTTDGTLNILFEDSSKGEWCIPCSCKKKFNIASPDMDLFKMMGEKTIICAGCGKDLDTRTGYYVHAFPERKNTFPGYHVSQVTHPLHCALPDKWKDLLSKMYDYSKVKFYNEVLGIPCDESVKLLSLQDLKDACNSFEQDYNEALKKIPNYDIRVLGVDWSGGGLLGHSYTSCAILAGRPGSDTLDTLFTARLPLGLKPEEESEILRRYMSDFKCHFMAHDYTGAGYLREVIMVQAGVPQNKFIPFTYAVSPKKDIISRHKPTDGARMSYIIDKPRSLSVLVNMIKSKKVSLPVIRKDNPVITDLLNLVEDPREMAKGNILYLITKAAGKPDDLAHALNFAASAIWFSRGRYPTLAQTQKYLIPKDILEQVDPIGMSKIDMGP